MRIKPDRISILAGGKAHQATIEHMSYSPPGAITYATSIAAIAVKLTTLTSAENEPPQTPAANNAFDAVLTPIR